MKIDLDTEIRQLLLEHVTSYEQLEALLLLHENASQRWSAVAVAGALHIDVSGAAPALTELVSHRLLAEDARGPTPEYQYALAGTDVGRTVDRLARAYAEQRLEVVKLMSSNAIERLRSSAARTFSDAFIFRRKKDDR